MSNLTEIVVRVTGNHPTGRRCRAGFIFGKAPSRVEVTAEELKSIQEDKFLLIVTAGGALEQAVKKTKAPNEADLQSKTQGVEKTFDDYKKKEIIEELTALKVEFNERDNKEILRSLLVEAKSKTQGADGNEGTDEHLNDLSVDEIVAKLEAKGLVEGTDFSKLADKADLIALLLS